VHHNASQALLSLIFEMEMTVVKVKVDDDVVVDGFHC
jgi:hypothetical protein